MARSLVDTDVMIDYLRGHTQAVDYLNNLSDIPLVSAISIAELYAGVREGEERTVLDLFTQGVEIPVNAEVAVQGGLFRRSYRKSHNVGLADAVIAATAMSEDATLVTLNRKHSPMLDTVIVPYQK